MTRQWELRRITDEEKLTFQRCLGSKTARCSFLRSDWGEREEGVEADSAAVRKNGEC